jgi:hypothetical protein
MGRRQKGSKKIAFFIVLTGRIFETYSYVVKATREEKCGRTIQSLKQGAS